VRILQLTPFSVPVPSLSGSDVRFTQNARAAALLVFDELVDVEVLVVEVFTDDELEVLVAAGLEVAVEVGVGVVEPPPPPQAVSNKVVNKVKAADVSQVVRMVYFSYTLYVGHVRRVNYPALL
jgi:hypothetical protein